MQKLYNGSHLLFSLLLQASILKQLLRFLRLASSFRHPAALNASASCLKLQASSSCFSQLRASSCPSLPPPVSSIELLPLPEPLEQIRYPHEDDREPGHVVQLDRPSEYARDEDGKRQPEHGPDEKQNERVHGRFPPEITRGEYRKSRRRASLACEARSRMNQLTADSS
jgi:hypothetical protein